MVNLREYRHLRAERNTLASFLAELPEKSVIERTGLEARKEKIEQMLASWAPSSDVGQVRQSERRAGRTRPVNTEGAGYTGS